jgi:hypothetical protein|nr:MAG TPA: hypothetical protein [Caudoviricetes sp.]
MYLWLYLSNIFDNMEIDVANVISGIGAIVAAWFSYNQYTRNKMTDIKVEQFKKEEERRGYKRSENSAKVFGEIWRVLFETKADRVYIVQPHPLGHASFLSIQFEVKRKGVEGMRGNIQNLPMSEVAAFSKQMVDEVFMYITNIDEQIDDRVIKSIMSSNGCESIIIKRMNNSNDWVGSIFCEYTTHMNISEEEARSILHEAAINIQYILPEFVDVKP